MRIEVEEGALENLWMLLNTSGVLLRKAHDDRLIDLDKPSDKFPKGIRFAVDQIGEAVAIVSVMLQQNDPLSDKAE